LHRHGRKPTDNGRADDHKPSADHRGGQMITSLLLIIGGYLGYKGFRWWAPAILGICGVIVYHLAILSGLVAVETILGTMLVSYIGYGIGLGIRWLMEPKI
jgi:hypothetical protein